MHCERVIAHISWKLKPSKKNYPTYDLELVVMINVLDIWRHYLLGIEWRYIQIIRV